MEGKDIKIKKRTLEKEASIRARGPIGRRGGENSDNSSEGTVFGGTTGVRSWERKSLWKITQLLRTDS